jgi:hypothetical protein
MENARARNAINNSRKVYASGTIWREMGALTIAVCNWLTLEDSKKEAGEVVAILEDAISSLANAIEANLYLILSHLGIWLSGRLLN